jgi:hypothetical protein
MHFDVFGPFEIPRNESKTLIDYKRLSEIEEEADEVKPGLSQACGCYVFVIRAAKGYTPWYVGQSRRSSILKEAFNDSNQKKFHDVMNRKGNSGTPMIFLLPMLTDGGSKFRKPTRQDGGLAAVAFLEQWLIGQALLKNADLVNVHYTKYLKNMHVTGIFNPKQGKPTNASQELCRAIR